MSAPSNGYNGRDKRRVLANLASKVDNIQINIYTNIPGKENTPIPFSRSLFADKINSRNLKLNDNPFFTTEYRIDSKIVTKSFDTKVKSLFDKGEFVKILVQKDASFAKKEQFERAEANIEILLQSLFPTYYPVQFNQTDTYSQMIESKMPSKKSFTSLFSYFNRFLGNTAPPVKKSEGFTDIRGETDKEEEEVNTEDTEEYMQPFCYLTIDGSIYTVLKVVYLNDFINNPKYYEILTKFTDILNWKEKQATSNQTKIYKYMRNIIDVMDRLKYDMNTLNYRYNFFNNLRSNSERDSYGYYRSDNTRVLDDIKKRTTKLFYSSYDYTRNTDKYFDTRAGALSGRGSSTTPTSKSINDVFDNLIRKARYIQETTQPNSSDITNSINDLMKEMYLSQNYDKIEGYDDNKLKGYFDEVIGMLDRVLKTTPTTPPTPTFSQDDVATLNEIKEIVIKNIAVLKQIKENSFVKKNADMIDKMVKINRDLERSGESGEEDIKTKTTYETAVQIQMDEYKDYIEFIKPFVRDESNSSNDSISFDSKFYKTIGNILEIFNSLVLEEKVQNVYFGTQTDVTKDVGKEVTQYFDSTHTKYSEFIQFINKYIKPNRESSNKQIYNMILDYIAGKPEKLKGFLEKIKKEEINDIKDALRLSYEQHYTRESSIPRYEIQVYMDLMKGRLTKDDIATMGCYFKDKELVGTHYNTVYKNLIQNAYIFDDKMPMLTVPKRDKRRVEGNTPSGMGMEPPTAGGGLKRGKRRVVRTRRKGRYIRNLFTKSKKTFCGRTLIV